MADNNDALTLPIEFPNAERTQLALNEVLKSLDGLTRKILESGAASEQNARKILALTQAFVDGKKTAGELRAELTALAGEAPKTAAALRREVAEAEKAAAAEAKKLEDATKAAGEKLELLDRRARTLGNGLEREAGAMSRFAERGVGLGTALGVALGGTVALAGGTVALMRTIGEASAGAEMHQRAMVSLGRSFDLVEQATNGALSATNAYRMQQALANAQVRVSREELALIARHAREHGDVTKTTAERVQELTEALIGGEQGGLQKFGISVDSTRTRTENLRSALQQMTRAAGDNAPATRTMGEELTRFNESLALGGDAAGRFIDHATGMRGAMASLGDEIRRVAGDMLELIEREERLPQQRAAQAARDRATQGYLTAQRGLANALQSQGFSETEARALIPATPVGRLTPEQIEAQARRLAVVQAQLGAERSNGISNGIVNPAEAPVSLAGVATLGASTVGRLGAADTAGALAGLRAARSGRSQAEVTRAQVRALLEGVAREMSGDAEANDRAAAARTREQPAGQATAQNNPQQLTTNIAASRTTLADLALAQFQAARERRVTDFGRNRAASMDAGDALTARELAETPAALARLGQLRDREARDREARLDDLRVSVDQAEELVRLRRQEERGQRPLFVARQNAILAAQADVAHQTRMVQLAAELSRVQSQGGRDAQIAEDRAGAQLSRARGRVSRASERAELRDPSVFNERAADAREERALSRERAQLQYRLDRQVTFTERMEELAGRRRTAAEMEAEGVTSAFSAMGEAYASHLQAVIQGKEDLGTALQGMLSDTLAAISKEASIKAGLYLAEGFASLVFYQYDRAANAFAAAGLYTAVAVGAGLGAGAIAPAKPAEGGAGGGASQDRGRPLDTGRGAANDNGRGGTTIIEQHYYAPVIGGRDATEAESGREMQRFTRAADRRRLGRTGS